MNIFRSPNVVLISEVAGANKHVCVGVLRTTFVLSDGSKEFREMPGKPHDELTIADCRGLLCELDRLERTRLVN